MRYFAPTQLSENIKETPEGFLICLGVPIARTGWQLYAKGEIPDAPIEADENGTIRIYRDPSEVFNAVTLASFEGKAFTIEHPMDWVTPMNWRDLAKGTLQNVRKSEERDQDGEESLLADVMVTDSVAIRLVKNGMRAVSCGYEAKYEQTEKGKGKQTNIVGNHLALVKAGRAGPGYAIHDHKTEGLKGMSKLADKVKQFFNKVVDEAAEEAEKKQTQDTISKTKDDDKKEDKEEKKEKEDSKDAKDAKDMGSVSGIGSYDELVAMVKDMSAKMASKDAMEERLKKCEDALSSIMEKEGKEDQEVGDESEESKEDKEDKDDSKTGDTASRAEILSPGIEITKDVKAKSLKAAYETTDGKEVIDSLTAGKGLTLDSADTVSNLFIAASEILRMKRGTGLENTKNFKSFDSNQNTTSQPMTPEKLNEINKQFYSQAK